jgi:hypothetical protein
MNRTARRACFVAYSGWGLAVLGMTLSQGRMPYAAFGFCGFALFFSGILLLQFTGRCLHCNRRLGQMLSQHKNGIPWRISQALSCCPFCGHSLDEPSPNSRNA